jgi:hypothetical protein
MDELFERPEREHLRGLIYVIVVSLMTAVIGWLFIPETKDRKIWDEFHELDPLPAQGDATRATA